MSSITENRGEVSLSAITEKLNALKKTEQATQQDISVFFLNNFTIDLIRPFLEFELLQDRINPQITFGLYDVILQNLMDPKSELFQSKPRLIVLSLIFDQFIPNFELKSWTVAEATNALQKIYDLILEKTESVVMVNTFNLPLYENRRGAFDQQQSEKLEAVNHFIREFVSKNKSRFCLADWNAYMAVLGAEKAIDLRYWYMSKAPFRPAFLSIYASEIGRLGKALSGRVKKVLVLDCDNTLWGGIVGEDGINGIKLHPSEYPGNVHYQFQKQILQLKSRGVLLAACSKNNEADVVEVFEKHPHSLLKPDDFVLKFINWENKADNIEAIAKKLNLGLDSFVFVDDSDFECNLVSSRLPQVQVLQVPKGIFELPNIFSEDPFFQFIQTAEDQKKLDQYRIKLSQEQSRAEFDNVEDYLASLQIEVSIRRMIETDKARVAQLTQKTNQFNLTTRRYTEAEIDAKSKSSTQFIYVMNVKDRFGDMGLTNVIIAELNGTTVTIDTNLMSCRVFERNIEYVFFDWCIRDIQKSNRVERVEASYIPTPKNAVCKDFWKKVGFTLTGEESQKSYYKLEITQYQNYSHPAVRIAGE